MPGLKPTMLECLNALKGLYMFSLDVKLESWLEPSEPDHFVLGLTAMLFADPDVDNNPDFPFPTLENKRCASLRGYVCKFEAAMERGFHPFDVLESSEFDIAGFAELLAPVCDETNESMWYANLHKLIEVGYGSDLLIFDSIDVLEPFRGCGLGLLLAKRVAEAAGNLDTLIAYSVAREGRDQCLAAEGRSQKDVMKLEQYFSRLGSVHIPASDIWVISPVIRWPTPEEMFAEIWRPDGAPYKLDRFQRNYKGRPN